MVSRVGARTDARRACDCPATGVIYPGGRRLCTAVPATGYLGLWTWEPADQRPIPLADEQAGTAVLS
jgi:hypothetical protein